MQNKSLFFKNKCKITCIVLKGRIFVYRKQRSKPYFIHSLTLYLHIMIYTTLAENKLGLSNLIRSVVLSTDAISFNCNTHAVSIMVLELAAAGVTQQEMVAIATTSKEATIERFWGDHVTKFFTQF